MLWQQSTDTLVLGGTAGMSVAGAVNFLGNLNVQGHVGIAGTLTVIQAANFQGAVGINDSLTVVGSLSVQGPIGINGSLTVIGTLSVSQNIELSGALHVVGTSLFEANITFKGNVPTAAVIWSSNANIWMFGMDDHGIDVYFYAEATGHTVTWDQDGDTNNGVWSFGATSKGSDVIFWGNTALYRTWWNMDGDTNGQWLFGDDAKGVMVIFNGATTGHLVQWDPDGDSNGQWDFGASTKGVMVKFYGAVANFITTWDPNDDTNGSWAFGANTYGLKVEFYSITTGCGVFWAPDGDTNAGVWSFGATGGAKGVDVYFYGNGTGSYMQWDQSANTVVLHGLATIDQPGTDLAAETNLLEISYVTGIAFPGVTHKCIDARIDHTAAFAGGNLVTAFLRLEMAAASTITGMSTPLYCAVEPGDCASIGTCYAAVLEFSADTARAAAPMAFIRFGDKDTVDATNVRLLFDIGAQNAMPVGTGAGQIYFDPTLKIVVNADTRYIVLSTVENTLSLGSDTAGADATFFADTTGCGAFWVHDADGGNGTWSFGAATGSKGVDVCFYGITNGASVCWDQSADQFNFVKSSIEMTGTITEGLASPYIGIGQSATPIAITTFADHVLGIGVWLELKKNAAFSLLGGYFKVQTDGSTEVPLAQLVAVAPRITVDMNLDTGYGVQSHMTISGTKTSSELISVSAYVNLGAGARTADRVCALQAMFDGSGTAGTVVGDATVARIVNGGTVITTDSILSLNQQVSAKCTQMMLLEQLNANPAQFPDGIIQTGQWLKTAFEAKSYLAAADEGIKLTVNEVGTHTGAVRGIHVAMTKMSGAITGAGSFSGIASDIQPRANVSNAYAFNAYTGISGTPSITYMSAYRCYCDDLGATHGNVYYYGCADLNIDSTNEASAGAGFNYFIRMYAHGGPPHTAFYFPSSVGIDQLIFFEHSADPVEASAIPGTQDARIKVLFGATQYYIPLYR